MLQYSRESIFRTFKTGEECWEDGIVEGCNGMLLCMLKCFKRVLKTAK